MKSEKAPFAEKYIKYRIKGRIKPTDKLIKS
jgi:hypothetical protein